MIINIIFDFWDTLFFSTPVNTAKINHFRLKRLQNVIQKTVISDYSFKQASNDFNRAWVGISKIREDQLVDIGINGHVKIIASIVAPSSRHSPQLYKRIKQALSFPLYEWVKPMPGALEVIKNLSKRIDIGLISNTGIDSNLLLEQLLEHYKCSKYFKIKIFSDVIGYLKPHPALIRDYLRKSNSNPDNTIIVGDSMNMDILGGNLIGLKTVLFRHNTFHKLVPFPEIDGQIIAPDYIITDLDEIISVIIEVDNI